MRSIILISLKIRLNLHCSDKIVKRSARVWRRFQTIP
ncbi:hypothetical protein BOSE62_50280 [Bosea sp. 62]|nr:hypothetical protein BOSE21B_100273 [Bosea sp. 21B]CAD5284706.1 hypothetical protein BOSE7B_41258 [Bosea sp. 7B]CAD5301669.1 hypothetical protein BOSE46_90639 [Bosea sp. 46]VVT57788.1 hypothetical protein BOS5A_200272 [Bosea sp. EC-HK365B]VXB31259.1 hypothetical protein BOSE29B_100080 [Bosea sp. 29B]VXB75170.1 hypothetical protein BOSE125_150080 [Bosea sp. 125]VXC63100.1 hypothetical protein BOSE62_50280 [Bosea sp. 62]VXC91927.1 hypothetical protein BOSE127_80041 [Bosea sp. 127]